MKDQIRDQIRDTTLMKERMKGRNGGSRARYLTVTRLELYRFACHLYESMTFDRSAHDTGSTFNNNHFNGVTINPRGLGTADSIRSMEAGSAVSRTIIGRR